MSLELYSGSAMQAALRSVHLGNIAHYGVYCDCVLYTLQLCRMSLNCAAKLSVSFAMQCALSSSLKCLVSRKMQVVISVLSVLCTLCSVECVVKC